ncbi:hypothetical protein B0H14DRAFT_327081 [Mycena olivaceomarginata]|nr:hypothetical protein B0H14DRAFT_327081 [Mycena olivaceomarginata]
MAPARLSCLDPICARLVKRTSGDMIISMCLGTTCLIPARSASCTHHASLNCGQRRSCPFTREAFSQPTTSLVPPTPSFTSPMVLRRRQTTSHAQGDCVNTRPHLHLHRRRPHLLFPYAIQVYPCNRSSRTPPRPPPVHAAALARFGAYATIHRIPPFIGRALPSRTSTVGRSRCASRRDTRCSKRCTHPALQLGDVRARRFGSSTTHGRVVCG